MISTEKIQIFDYKVEETLYIRRAKNISFWRLFLKLNQIRKKNKQITEMDISNWFCELIRCENCKHYKKGECNYSDVDGKINKKNEKLELCVKCNFKPKWCKFCGKKTGVL